MAESNTDKQIGKINETMTGIRLEFADMKAEQKLTNKSVETLCEKLDGYAEGTEKRLGNLEEDVGNRIPDDPTAFSQIQGLQSHKKRTDSLMNRLWGLVSGAVVAIFALIASQVFGWFGKGN